MSYIPPHFRVADEQTLVDFMQTHDFATIVSHSSGGLVASHIPVLARRRGEVVVIAGHMARANQHWRLMDGATPAIFIFHGPHGYVSPTWYEAGPAVPTWNYSVVHAHGLPQASEDETFLRGVLEELVRRYEGNRANGWRIDSVPTDFYNQLRRGIVGFEMAVTKLDGKFKLGQNRSVEDRRRTIDELERSGSPEAAGLAELMRHRSGAGG
jgi:transcriptional regulator